MWKKRFFCSVFIFTQYILTEEHGRSERTHEAMRRERRRERRTDEPEAGLHSLSGRCPLDSGKCGFPSDDPSSPSVDECYRALMDLVDMNLSALNGEDHSGFDESIRTNLNGKTLYITVRTCCLMTTNL